MHLIGTILAVIAAGWVYTDAKKRGQTTTTAVLWSVFTLLFLVIGLPLYLLFGRKKAMPITKRQDQDNVIDIEGEVVKNMITCPMCGQQTDDAQKTCSHCGFSLKRTCPKCGVEVERHHSTCPNCSAVLDGK